MIVKIFNRIYDDEIEFKVKVLDEETRQDILSRVRARGWEDNDCWSEVEDDE